jgi:hypothetical protein
MTMTTTTPPAVRTRRPYRLGIDAHTEFVAVLVSELDAAVASLHAAAGTARPAAGEVDLFDPSAIDRSVTDGALDAADDRRAWQLRCGRRVLEGQGCRVRLLRVPDGYRLEIRAFEP